MFVLQAKKLFRAEEGYHAKIARNEGSLKELRFPFWARHLSRPCFVRTAPAPASKPRLVINRFFTWLRYLHT
jgi:hypothetical protein